MKKIVTIGLAIIAIIAMLGMITGCATCERSCKSCASDITGGLYRTVKIYSYTGQLIATYEGKLDLQENENKVLFDLNGKRYVYYNAVVEVIEK